MERKLRFVTIGTSGIVNRFLSALSYIGGVTCVGCYSRSIERARSFAQTAHIANPLLFDSLDDLSHSPDVDAVYIASPIALHAPQAQMLAKRGKHLLVEKSFASTAREAQMVFDVADVHDVVVMEGMRSLYEPGFSVIEKAAMHGLGAVRLATFRFGKVSSKVGALHRRERANTFDPHLSAGGLMDLGVYTVEPAIALFGMPQSIEAKGYVVDCPGIPDDDPYRRTDLAGQVLLDYIDHSVSLSYSRITDELLPSEIQGELGTLIVDSINSPYNISLHVHEDAGAAYGTTSGKTIQLFNQTSKVNMIAEIAAFRDAVEGNPETLKKLSKFRRVTVDSLTVMEEIRRQLGVRFPADSVITMPSN